MTAGKNAKRQEFHVVESTESLSRTAADEFVLRATDAIGERGRFVVALSGGSTPKPLFQLLATSEYASRVDWHNVHVCWGDERCVSPDDERSNFRMASDALLAHVPIPAANVHRMRGEDAPEGAATEYETELRELFDVSDKRDNNFPSFDLILLGLGTDGHTASLFPHSAALYERTRWIVAEYGESVEMWRLTFTLPLINASRRVLFLVAGADKADVVRDIRSPIIARDPLPAELVAPDHGVVHWLFDKDAYSKMPSPK